MHGIIEWFTRKRLLLVSVILMLPLLTWFDRVLFTRLYTQLLWWGNFTDYYELVMYFSIPMLLFSLVFLFIKSDRTFTSWKNTLLIFLLVYILILWHVPWYDNDAFLNLVNKSNVAKLLAFVYTICSLLYIAVLSLRSARQSQKRMR